MQTRATPVSPSSLERFNAAPAEEAVATLLTCLDNRHWAERVASHRPYPDPPSLLAAADEAAYDLSPDDLTAALAAEALPPLPEDMYAAAHTALSAATTAYERRFGHTFVVCLDGLSPGEALDHALAGIRSRLTNDRDEERQVAADELRRLARSRLTDVLQGRGELRERPSTPHTRRTTRSSSP
ncbi:2-oxo-4-hydroxy-4-carboxy-5-ureidoimidazoline decarboxylase [Streptomyces ziwulingensis]